MTKIITSALLALGITAGAGTAMADGYHERVVVHERGPRERVVVTHYRDYHHRPVARYERHEFRRGYRWQEGRYNWQGGEWIWAPGIYVRL